MPESSKTNQAEIGLAEVSASIWTAVTIRLADRGTAIDPELQTAEMKAALTETLRGVNVVHDYLLNRLLPFWDNPVLDDGQVDRDPLDLPAVE